MLFPYRYIIEHEIENFQKYLDFLFRDVWYPAAGPFSPDLLAGHADLHRIYFELDNVDGVAADRFCKGIIRIYNSFLTISPADREQLRKGYINNNDIAGLCSDKTIRPLTYNDIKAISPDLEKDLKNFYKGIYSSGSFFNLKAFGFMYTRILHEHYKAFTTENDDGICPFCGISDIKGPDDEHRDAYDHYFPKGIYPFSALNFYNLVPMCNECNSTYKLQLDPIFTDTKDRTSRVLAYNPFDVDHVTPTFSIVVTNPDHATLSKDDILISAASPECDEQLASWFRVFGLEARYKSQLTKKKKGRHWIQLILSANSRNEKHLGLGELSTEDHTATSMFNTLIANARFDPCAELGFLKVGFLTACADVGMFKELKLPVSAVAASEG